MRDVDRIIAAVEADSAISPVQKRVLINRIDPPPTREELDRAKRDLGYPYDLGLADR
jgi:hypothetical protein